MSSQSPLKLCFLPFFGGASHTFSLLHIARYFAFHGQQVTIITTPSNATVRIQKYLNKDNIQLDGQITVHTIPLFLKEAGLPEDFDELKLPKDLEGFQKFHRAVKLLRQPVQEFLELHDADCIISDILFPWYADLAAHLKIPYISFDSSSVFYSCVPKALRSPHSPHHQIESNDQPFVLSGLPVPITLTKAELTSSEALELFERVRKAASKSYAVLFNSFQELESDNIEYYSKITGLKVIAIGPASEIHRKLTGRTEKDYNKAQTVEILSWLNSKKPHSVLYICSGTALEFPDEQLFEIACALETSGHEFIWVVPGKEDENEEDNGKWLPVGFHDKIKGRGKIVKGWAPQLLILDHPSVGGFMTHCGWNSVLEGLTFGVPMITWPSTFDQFYNEKFVVQVAGVGVGVGAREWVNWFDVGRMIIRRENIEEAIVQLMGDGDKSKEMRMKIKEYGEMAKRAVEEGGSSKRNIIDLIEGLKKVRDFKVNNNEK